MDWKPIPIGELEKSFKNEEDPKTANKKEGVAFSCPICQSDKYEGIRPPAMSIRYGGSNPVVGYKCSGCSVRFEDPRKFSKK